MRLKVVQRLVTASVASSISDLGEDYKGMFIPIPAYRRKLCFLFDKKVSDTLLVGEAERCGGDV
jgi:hypothetical protein